MARVAIVDELADGVGSAFLAQVFQGVLLCSREG